MKAGYLIIPDVQAKCFRIIKMCFCVFPPHHYLIVSCRFSSFFKAYDKSYAYNLKLPILKGIGSFRLLFYSVVEGCKWLFIC